MRAPKKQTNRDHRVIVRKMQTWKKIFYAIFVSLLCFIITKGDPKRSNGLKSIEITDERLEYILETTIAMQTKTIRQKITEQNDGIWKLMTYVNEPKWAEIEVELKTRIGIRLNSITYDKAYNNVHIDFGDPQVLDRSYTTKMISSSDGFFSRWSIASFEQHKDQFLSELVENESNDLVDIFKKDNKMIRKLEGEYHSKVLASLNSKYHELDPEVMVWKLNQYILNFVSRIISPSLLPSINNSSLYTKKVANKSEGAKQTGLKPADEEGGAKDKVWGKQKKINQKYPEINRNQYNQKELSQRQKLKKKLFEKK